MTNKTNGKLRILFDGKISIKYNGTDTRNNIHNLDINIDGREEVECSIDEFINGINKFVNRNKRNNKRQNNQKRIKE